MESGVVANEGVDAGRSEGGGPDMSMGVCFAEFRINAMMCWFGSHRGAPGCCSLISYDNVLCGQPELMSKPQKIY